MEKLMKKHVILVAGLLLLAILSACQSARADAPKAAATEAATEVEAPSLATAAAVTRLSNQPGRAIVSARGNHFIVDSVPPIGGPNEEINPLDVMLGAMATCGTFIYETAAQEMGIDLDGITATVEGDFDPAGLKGEGVDPRLQAFRVHLDVPGATEEQLEELEKAYTTRCPIYTTLSRSAPIEITTNEEQPSSPAEGLATGIAVAQVSNQPGRAIVSAREPFCGGFCSAAGWSQRRAEPDGPGAGSPGNLCNLSL